MHYSIKILLTASALALLSTAALAQEKTPETISRNSASALAQAQQIVLSWPDLLAEKRNLAEAVLKLKTESDEAAAYWKSWCGEKPGCDISK